MDTEFIVQMDAVVEEEWDRIKAGSFAQHVLNQGIDAELYRLTMLQIYHPTRR